MNLVGTIASWLGRALVLLVVIVAILTAGNYFKGSIDALLDNIAAVPKLEDAHARMKKWADAQVKATTDRVRLQQKAGANSVQKRVLTIEGEIGDLKSEPRLPKTPSDFVVIVLTGNLDKAIEVEMKLELLAQERDFLKQVLSFEAASKDIARAQIELERLLQAHISAWRALNHNEDERKRIEALYPYAHRVPWMPAARELQQLLAEYPKLWIDNQHAYDAYIGYKRWVDILTLRQKIPQFALAQDSIQSILERLESSIAELKQMRDAGWLTRLQQEVSPFIPGALLVLALGILIPFLIKVFLYCLAAPAAGRRPALRLLPTAAGKIASAGSAVSQSIAVDSASELLIRADYLQSTSRAGDKQTMSLLNSHYPFASIASGMFALTRIRSDSTESVVVSSTRDPWSEIAAIELAAGSAVILQPQYLVGVVQRRDQPMVLTHQWRWRSLHAWLTLQFRYLVFHGPAVLLVKGCRGVRVERPEAGRSINQDATIGFSANLYYATTRCETFFSYFSGQKALFNDSFSGRDGYFIYQTMPRAQDRTGVTGRGLEGILDAFLKAFGI